MTNEFPRPRAVARMLLDSALLAILMAVGFTLLPDKADSMALMFPTVLCTAAMMFRIDAHSTHDLVTRKRLLVAGLAGLWGVFISTAGQSIVVGHYSGAGAMVCLSLVLLLTIRSVLRSAPEQWLGANWQDVVNA